MPSFTLELWRASEFLDGNIGLDLYPIFDEGYREGLNKKIFDHYRDREIEGETTRRFQFFMRRRMNEIMPAYNQLYESERLKFDPLSTVDIKTVSSGTMATDSTADSETEQTAKTASESRAVTSVLPQVRLSGDGDYATNAVDSVGANSSEGSGVESSKASSEQASESTSQTTGYQGSASELLLAYRRTFMNIDMMVIDELGDLFINVWTTGDTHRFNFSELPETL